MKNHDIPVKLCPRCGMIFSSKAEECEVCGAELGEPVKNGEAKSLSRKIAKNYKKQQKSIADEKLGGSAGSTGTDIPVTGWNIAVGILAVIAALGTIAILVISIIGRRPDGELWLSGNIAILLMLAVIIFDSFFPGAAWDLAHWDYSLHYDSKPYPSDIHIFLTKLANTILIIGAFAAIAVQLFQFLG